MSKRKLCWVVLVCAGVSAPLLPKWTLAQATRPSATGTPAGNVSPALEQLAGRYLASGDYAAALPLLRRMADFYKDDPRKLKAVQEQITLCEKQLNAGNAAGQNALEVRKPIVLPPDGGVLAFDSIKDLGNFEYDPEKGGGIPADVQAVSGHTVRLKGFMIPMDQAESVTNFALVPSLFSCCFGGPPSIQHTVVVKTPKGKAVSYYPDEIMVEGKLNVQEKKEDGFIVSVFELAATSVRPAPH